MTDLGRIRRRATTGRVITERPVLKPDLHSEDDFITRVQLALDKTPKELANALHVSTRMVVDRVGPRSAMSSFATDPFWQLLASYIDERVAGLLALKDELDRKARLDYREHATRVARVRDRK
jgi:hypothetical protein